MDHDPRRIEISGQAVSVRGNDIDTDRIIPARFLKCVEFDGLGEHIFADDRRLLRAAGRLHPLDQPEFAQAELLFVNKNFGCGSSREHAPQGIRRWRRGIRAIVGESFAEIFFGNCVALGLPCVTVDEKTIQRLMGANESEPHKIFTLDLETKTIAVDGESHPVALPEGARRAFIAGRWDSTRELLENRDAISAAAARLPYFQGWK